MKNWLLITANLLCMASQAQDSMSFPGQLVVRGYVKDMQVLNFNKGFNRLISSNLIHNRINVKWKPLRNTTVVTELRNRVFWGDEVKLTPGFVDMLQNQNEKLNMQKAWVSDSGFVVHTNVERLYFDYNSSKVNIRIGRQRINWGMTTTWNPNDIFNTYNFLDFDYEERPGADGGKFQYRFKNSINVEVAYANTGKDNNNANIVAAKFFMNKWNYDMQIISGLYKDHATVGYGWAGSIKDVGFKGEVQYFFRNLDSGSHFNLTLEGDYMFKKGWYLNTGVLLNTNGLDKPVTAWEAIGLRISPEQLMPTKWNLIVTTSKEINPLFSASASILYAPGTNLLIILPSLQYSIMENLALNFFWQSFFASIDNRLDGAGHRCFLRLKWSF